MVASHKWNIKIGGYLKIYIYYLLLILRKRKIVSLEVTSKEVNHRRSKLRVPIDNARE